jgi:signal transduction histidine kinase
MLAKGDHRNLPLEIKEVSVSNITSAALRSLDSDNTRIEEELDSSGRVQVDADRIQQALSNLLSNAVRYGGDRVILRAAIVGEDLVVEVHDNGDGVPTRFEGSVWQRFERGAHRLNASTPGLGIGLAIVEAVAESHGGRASYRTSERLGGACFSVEIPGCVVEEKSKAEVVEVST